MFALRINCIGNRIVIISGSDILFPAQRRPWCWGRHVFATSFKAACPHASVRGRPGGQRRSPARPWKSGVAAARACRQASRVWRGRTCRRASQSVARPFAPLLGCFQIRTPPVLKRKSDELQSTEPCNEGWRGRALLFDLEISLSNPTSPFYVRFTDKLHREPNGNYQRQ